MASFRSIVYVESDVDEDDEGRPVVYVEAVQRGGEYARVELTPEQAEELASLMMEAVEAARRGAI